MNRFFKTFLSLFLASFIIISITACDNNETHQKNHLRIGMNTWPGYEPLALAKKLDLLDENILVSRVRSATDVIKAFKNDIYEIACVTLDEALILSSTMKEPFKIILIFDFSHGGDALLAQNGIKTMADLKGHRIGVESSALGAFVLTRSIELSPKLKYEDISIVPLSYDKHEKAFVRKEIDAVVTFEPTKTKLLSHGAEVLFDSTQIPGEIIDVMIVKDKTLKTHGVAIDTLIHAWFKTLIHIKEDPKSSNELMAKLENISTNEFILAVGGIKRADLEDNQKYLSTKSPKIFDIAKKIETVLLRYLIIDKKVTIKDLISDSFIKDITP